MDAVPWPSLPDGYRPIISGPSTNLDVSLPLTPNTDYSAFIQAVDLDGNPNSATLTFDTVVPLYTFDGVETMTTTADCS